MISRLSRKLLGDEQGNAVIELALITPLFMTLIVGVFDMTTAYNRKIELTQATQRSIEKVMQTTTDTTVDVTVVDEAAAAAGVPVSQVTLETWLECDGTRMPNYDDDCDAGETTVRYQTVAITDEFTPMFPLSYFGISDPSWTITAESGIRRQ